MLIASCGAEEPVADTDTPRTPAAPAPAAGPSRDEWQRPQELLNVMGAHLVGNTVADLFADDGYFTFKLLDAGANVIAVVDSEAKAIAIRQEKDRQGIPDTRLQVRVSGPDEPGLGMAEADVALLAHSYLKIPDRASYFEKLRAGLREPRTLYILDWQYRLTPIGPPIEQRIRMEDVMDEMGIYGFAGVGALGNKIPYHVIYMASDAPPGEEIMPENIPPIEVRPMD